jgi:hypothetical protein
MWLCSWLQTHSRSKAKSAHETARIDPAAACQEAKVPETNTADESFCVGNVKIGASDLTGKRIEEIYVKVNYAVYRTTDRVAIQYADCESEATEQRQHMSSLNLVRAQISGLISDWTKSKHKSFKEKSAVYEGRVASTLILCLEGDGVAALASLNDIKKILSLTELLGAGLST